MSAVADPMSIATVVACVFQVGFAIFSIGCAIDSARSYRRIKQREIERESTPEQWRKRTPQDAP